MRMPSRTVLILLASVIILLLATVSFLYYANWRMQRDVETGEFEQQYAEVIDQLNSSMGEIQSKLSRTGHDVAVLNLTKRSQNATRTGGNTTSGIILQGIFWQKEAPLSMINDRIYEVGEQIGGWTLKEITPDSILLEGGNGKTQTIRLMEDAR
jgi:hypothetical protein